MAIDPVALGLTAGINALAKIFMESVWKHGGQKGQQLLDEIPLNFQATAQQYAEKYYWRYGLVKPLGVSEPVSLDELYITVQVLGQNLAKCLESLDSQAKFFKEQRSGYFHAGQADKKTGLTAANEHPFLMVLGGPGIGKSTFLRKVGLEALKGSAGEYGHPGKIPVLLELRAFRTGPIDLRAAIAQEFANCGLSEYEQCVQKLLEDGQLLILLDGLDEVPTAHTAEMVSKIEDFVSKYDRNRYIASCRIAAYRHNFSRFTDITIANFDDHQIENFISSWFASYQQEEWGKVCWAKLQSAEHRSTKELAHTPLLLTLICILHRKTGQFPTKKATLYDDALRVLLNEWDASKAIVREVIYQGLDSKGKTLMLAEVAYQSFAADQLFLQRFEISKLVEAALREMLPDQKVIDGQKVIEVIESQHGLLVKRDEGIYSFSHLTIQEYLTAYHVLEKDLDLDELVREHLLDRTWREVFILIAGIKQPDKLLQVIEQQVHKYMNTDKLQAVLAWVDQVSDPEDGNVKAIGKRSLAIANAYANAVDAVSISDNVIIYANVIAKAIANAYAIVVANAIAYANSRVIATARISPIAIAVDELLEYSRFVQRDSVSRSIDLPGLINSLEQCQREVPDQQESIIVRCQFAQQLIQTWRKAFQLTPEMLNLSASERQAIEDYLYATKLLIDCRQAAVRVNLAAWQAIESRLLRPTAVHQY